MKRRSDSSIEAESSDLKKKRIEEETTETDEDEDDGDLGEDLVLEILKRADERTVAVAACVSRRWRKMAEDERLWESVCTPRWAAMGCGERQLRSVVNALGGFRRLHSIYMVPLRAAPAAVVSPPPAFPLPYPPEFSLPAPSAEASRTKAPVRWGKDEVQLSMSLLSIGYFGKMGIGYGKRGGGGGCR